MTKGSFYGDRYGFSVQTRLALVDLIAHPPILKSLLLRRNSIETRWPGSKRVWCRLFALPSSAPHRSPLSAPLIPVFHAPLVWFWSPSRCCCRRKRKKKSLRSAALHVCLHNARSEKRSRTGVEDPRPRLRPLAMVPEYSYRHGSLEDRTPALAREQSLCVRQPTKVPTNTNLRTRASLGPSHF
jgi:hypothetical protein